MASFKSKASVVPADPAGKTERLATPPPAYTQQPRANPIFLSNDGTVFKNQGDINSGAFTQNVPTKPSKVSQCKIILTDCSENIGIPGVPNFFKAPNIPMKLLWVLANIVCWGLFALVLYQMTIKYLSYPTVVSVDVQVGTNLDFPAVTVCNLNRVIAERISKDSKYYGLTKLYEKVYKDIRMKSQGIVGLSYTVDAASCDFIGASATEYLCPDKSNCIELSRKCDGRDDCYDKGDEDGCPTAVPHGENYTSTTEEPKQHIEPDMTGILNDKMYTKIDWNKPNWYEVYSNSITEDYRDIYPMTYMNRSEIEEWGIASGDFLLTCSYDQNNCGGRDFYEFIHERFGKCFTFNSALMERTSLFSDDPKKNYSRQNDGSTSYVENTARTGALYGLKLSLWLDTDNYISIISPAEGAILSVHNPRVEPDMDTNTIVVEPGIFSFIGVKRVTIERLGPPFSDCIDSYPEDLPMPEYKREKYLYNQQICVNYCYQKVIEENCGCYESYITDADVLCDHTNATTAQCVSDTWRKLTEGEVTCSMCPMACWDDYYETSVSSSSWPTDRFMPFIVDYAWNRIADTSRVRSWLDEQISGKGLDADDLGEAFREQLARFSVHFETMSYETIKFYESYTLIQYIADIGGYMGLFVGVCAMTVFELFDFGIQLACCLQKN